MNEQAITQRVRDYIMTNLNKAGSDDPLTDAYPLLKSGYIDSLSLFTLITFIEQEFRVEIRPQEIVPDNFASLNIIAAMVAGKLAVPESVA